MTAFSASCRCFIRGNETSWGASVAPMYIDTSDYLQTDAKGAKWTTFNADAIAEAKAQGKKGVIIDNVVDEPNSTSTLGPQKIFVTFPNGQGTVKSKFAARFEEYLTCKHSGAAAPRSALEAAERIGWQAHTVSKRCENIRNRYVRIGVPGLRGPRALEELAALLISTGELTTDDLRRLPPKASPPAS